MAPPIPGITIPVEWVRVIDADTLVVRSGLTGREITVRLKGCDAPPKATTGGMEAMHFVESYLEEYAGQPMLLHLDWPEDTDGNGTLDMDEILRQLASFERTVGTIWVGGYSLGETLGARGYAHVG